MQIRIKFHFALKIRINKKFLPHANVGRITNKTRDTANRTNGFERLREFPSINGISTDSISDSDSKSQVRLNKLQNYSISQKERTRKWSQVCGIQVPLEETKPYRKPSARKSRLWGERFGLTRIISPMHNAVKIL